MINWSEFSGGLSKWSGARVSVYLGDPEIMKLVLPGEDVALGAPNGSFPISTRRSSELFTELQSEKMRQWSKVKAGDSSYM